MILTSDLCVLKGYTLQDLVIKSDVISISVSTPMNKDGSCHLTILESVVKQISNLCDLNKQIVVIRCIVPPGTSDRLNCYYMPEFLTEKNYLQDFINNKEWIFGVKGTEQDEHFKYFIKLLHI